jgi:hypothetical protein
MDKTQETSGSEFDMLNKQKTVPKKLPKTVAPPPVGQKLLTEEEKKKFKDLKKTVEPIAGENQETETGSPAAKEKSAGVSSLLEGNNKYIVIAVALLAVYFLFIKKR